MKFIDIHCHLNEVKNLEKAIKKAKEVVIFNAGLDYHTNLFSLKVSKLYENVFACLGLYPVEAIKMSEEEINKILEQIKENKDQIVGISEVGLDYYWVKDEKEREKEKEVFKKVIDLAEEIKKPLIVHSRNAEEDIIETLKNVNVPVVLHSFGGEELVKRAVDYGFFISFAPIIKRSNKHKRMIEKIPLENIVTETDSPYLGPEKGVRNEPYNVKIVYEEIAKIKEINIEELKKIIWKNVRRVIWK